MEDSPLKMCLHRYKVKRVLFSSDEGEYGRSDEVNAPSVSAAKKTCISSSGHAQNSSDVPSGTSALMIRRVRGTRPQHSRRSGQGTRGIVSHMPRSQMQIRKTNAGSYRLRKVQISARHTQQQHRPGVRLT